MMPTERKNDQKQTGKSEKYFACQRDDDDEIAVFDVVVGSVPESLESFKCECVKDPRTAKNCCNVLCFIWLFCIVVLFSRATVKFVLRSCAGLCTGVSVFVL